MTSSLCRAVCLSTFLFAIAGCASVDPQPFCEYETATRGVQAGVDSVFLLDLEWTTDSFVERIADGTGDYRELTIVFPDDPASFHVELEREPLHHVIAKAARQMSRLNRAFSDYAALLTRLAGPETLDPETFDRIAGDVNDGVRDAGRALEGMGVSMPSGSDRRAGLISIAAAESFRAYVTGERRSELGDGLGVNQAAVERWSGLAVQVLGIIRDDVQAEYARKKQALNSEISGAKPEKRRKPARALLELNAAVLEAMETLAGLNEAYTRMPGAHADLRRSLEEGGRGLEALEAFVRQASRLRDLHRDLTDKTEPE